MLFPTLSSRRQERSDCLIHTDKPILPFTVISQRSGEIWLLDGDPVLIEPDFSQVRNDTLLNTIFDCRKQF